ncbi:MAG: NnrS family protein [Deltaproteobacteria bacterium]|nr:NnrS family protein [Deltaproteobacteria bacterium]
MKTKEPIEPYRLYFPLGALAAIAGTLPWVTFGFGLSGAYPGLVHPDLMVGGFLFAFAAGFLMTAVPQFTGSARCRPGELAFGGVLFAALASVSFCGNRAWFHALSFASLACLALFCASRVRTRSHEPPRFFVFVGLGLLMGLAGALLLAAGDFGWLSDATWLALAKLLYTQGMTLSLILGVGTHLLPAIWGWSDLPIQITKLNETPNPAKVIGPVLALAMSLLASFWLEVRWSQRPRRAWPLDRPQVAAADDFGASQPGRGDHARGSPVRASILSSAPGLCSHGLDARRSALVGGLRPQASDAGRFKGLGMNADAQGAVRKSYYLLLRELVWWRRVGRRVKKTSHARPWLI